MCEVQASFTVALPKTKTQEVIKNVQKLPQKKCKSVMMSFVDNLWSLEVSGGYDQFSPLTVIAVKKNGLARRAGIKVGDVITHINNMPADRMTLHEAQREIKESGRNLRLIVKGDSDDSTTSSSSSSEDDETSNTVDFWFKPMKPEELNLLEWQRKRDEKRRTTKLLYQDFPWNDRKKPTLRASNCFMVTEKNREREIKLKATKERFIASEKLRLLEVENRMQNYC